MVTLSKCKVTASITNSLCCPVAGGCTAATALRLVRRKSCTLFDPVLQASPTSFARQTAEDTKWSILKLRSHYLAFHSSRVTSQWMNQSSSQSIWHLLIASKKFPKAPINSVDFLVQQRRPLSPWRTHKRKTEPNTSVMTSLVWFFFTVMDNWQHLQKMSSQIQTTDDAS